MALVSKAFVRVHPLQLTSKSASRSIVVVEGTVYTAKMSKVF
jgi:hypothetical protein